MRKIYPNSDNDVCQVPKCNKPVELIYYGFAVCDSCWEKHCNQKISLDKIFKVKNDG